MVTRVPAARQVLEWARKACGLTVEEAAGLLGCKPDSLRDIEEGKKLPSVTMFRDMASCYGFPEATLLAETPPALPKLPTDFRTFDGAAPRLSYRTYLAIRRVQMRQESIRELSELDESVAAPDLRHLEQTKNPAEAGAAERKAFGVSVADQLKLSAEKLWMNYRLRVENLGISVYVEDFPVEDCRGVSVFVDNFPAIMLTNEEREPGWKIFSLIHEYAHLLIRQPGISDQRSATRHPTERFCNQFTASFLMPEDAITSVLDISRDEPQELSVAALGEAARQLRVSLSALALRLEELGFAPAGYYGRIREKIKPVQLKKKTSGQIPREYVILNQMGHRFSGDVLRSVESGAITSLEASRILGTNPLLLPTISETIESRRREYLYAGAES